LLLASQLEGEQSATSTLSGTTPGSTESSVTLTISQENSQINVNGNASTAANGTGETQSSSKTSGYVRSNPDDDKNDGTYVANSSVGITAAQGGAVDTTTAAWGSSGTGGLDGPTANAGHNVTADGPYTGSTGDQAVALLSEKP
jgi:hypothetical protein